MERALHREDGLPTRNFRQPRLKEQKKEKDDDSKIVFNHLLIKSEMAFKKRKKEILPENTAF